MEACRFATLADCGEDNSRTFTSEAIQGTFGAVRLAVTLFATPSETGLLARLINHHGSYVYHWPMVSDRQDRPRLPPSRFLQLDATLALNGVTAQPLMHAVLLNALPVELRHLATASTSSPQPYDDLCAAVLACYGLTYRPLRWSPKFQASPPSQQAVLTDARPYLGKELTPPSTTPTSDAATRASIPAPDHHPSRVPSIRTPSPTSTARNTAETLDSTTATLPHALESDNVIVSSAIRPPITEVSPSTIGGGGYVHAILDYRNFVTRYRGRSGVLEFLGCTLSRELLDFGM
ncbi:hypothetical protein HPB52_008823 [Rhipicephalus sanguineus]|uniref:Uncharacterized protein n=1 Tax=Rhipicephalus sanguineus TaxID=34632 RepID=A0A9D4T8Z6_RHISA|nr:hypothetical protein HPB52_008823 [Rhipicephalus sanguineus]